MRERIGPYRIESVIAEGGMGKVYKGRHESLGRCAAIKTLLPKNALDPSSRDRFLQEARTQALIAPHPNVVAVYELIPEDGALFIAMEYVEGETLAALLRRSANERLGFDEALPLIVQMLAALEHIHGQRIIHRDVKPSNVVIRDGLVKLTDFGIALMPDAPRLTASQQWIGTLAYMSPEQLQGGDVDARTDVYSAGVVLYAMLAGRLPFPSRDILQAISERMAGPPELRADLPGGVREAVGIALQWEPERRFPSAVAFAGALRDVTAGFLHPAVDPQEEIPTEVVPEVRAPAEEIVPPAPRWSVVPWIIITGSLAASGYVMVRHTPRFAAVASVEAGALPPLTPIDPTTSITSTNPPPPPSKPPVTTSGSSPIPTDRGRARRDAEDKQRGEAEEKQRREAEEKQRKDVERLRHEIQSAIDRAEDAMRAERFDRAVAELDSAAQKALSYPDDFWQEREAITRLHAAIVDARVTAATRVQQKALWERSLADVEEDLRHERWPEAERFARQIAEDANAPSDVAERARSLLQQAKEGRISAFGQTQLGPTQNTIRKPSTPPGKKKN